MLRARTEGFLGSCGVMADPPALASHVGIARRWRLLGIMFLSHPPLLAGAEIIDGTRPTPMSSAASLLTAFESHANPLAALIPHNIPQIHEK